MIQLHESGRKNHTLSVRVPRSEQPKSPETIVAEGSQSRTDPGVSDTPNWI